MTLKIDQESEPYLVNILPTYKEGSRTGKISLLKHADTYQIVVNWDEPRYDKIVLFSGELQDCIDFSLDRFQLSREMINSLRFD